MSSTQLGQYELITRIAHGGMAEIYLAKRRGPGGFDKRVVIKRVLPHLCENQDFVQMFLDEAKLASRLSHPNIVQIFDFGQLGETYYLCMEHLDGEDLAAVLRILREKGDPMPPQVASCILSAACDGMHYAHTFSDETGLALKIVHRDLSPSNLFLTAQGAVKVLDFGVAKMEGKATQTQSGVVKGKFAYLSPEQANSAEIDARSDVFALGLILHECLTGTKVFSRGSEAATLKAVLTETVPSPRLTRADIPRELEAIVMKACARSPEDRWPSAQAMRGALDEYLANRGSVPSSSVLQSFMLGILGEAKHRQSIPTPTASMLGAVSSIDLDMGQATDAHALQSETIGPPEKFEGTLAATPPPLSIKIARSPDSTMEVAALEQEARSSVARAASTKGDPAQERGPKRSIILVAAVSLIAALATGAWVLSSGVLLAGSEAKELDEASQGAGQTDLARPASTGPEAAAAHTAELAVEGSVAAVGSALSTLDAQGGDSDPRQGAEAAQATPAPTAKNPLQSKGSRKGRVQAARISSGPKQRRTQAASPQTNIGQPGLLNINCDPWCRVYVDGRDTGKNSPAVGLKFPAGKHRVKVLHQATGMTREKDVVLVAGETRSIKIRF